MSDHSELDALIKASIAIFKAMTPEQRAAVMEAQRQSWVRGEQDLRRPTESASPPRVPGASAHPLKVGVESGPGQPIPPHVPDVADALDGWAAQYSEPENINARHLREAAAEIRRLRAEVEPLRDPAMLHANLLRGFPATLTQEQRLHLVGSAKIDEIRADGFRAGIEAAARWHDEKADFCARNFGDGDIGAKMIGEEHREYAGAIRALADKPAPDERKRCLEIVQRHIDAEVHATFANGATLQDAFTAGCEMTAKAIFDDIAGTQRFATPIVNIDGDVKQERFDAPFAARKGG